MYIIGFTFIRNAIKFDFPVVESIKSALPICDEFVVAVGKSDDDTLNLIRHIDPQKIRIVETVWDESLQEGGQVYAKETDKALRTISTKADWAFYVQGDEVIHEKYYDSIRASMEKWKDDSSVDGLLFDYVHFYGSYNYVGDSPNWYSKEIRIVRPRPDIYSYRDAQGFRKGKDEKLDVKSANAQIYHYGWVKDPLIMQNKHLHIHHYWYGDEAEKHVKVSAEGFDYSKVDSLTIFTGTHPEIMKNRISKQNWDFTHDISYKNMSFKNRLKLLVKRLTSWEIGQYKNYKSI